MGIHTLKILQQKIQVSVSLVRHETFLHFFEKSQGIIFSYGTVLKYHSDKQKWEIGFTIETKFRYSGGI